MNNNLVTDDSFMRLALALAKRGQGTVSPNPLVGCIIVKNDKIIGTGYHELYGGPHAEVNAIKNATEDVEGADLFVNLEPCSHHGKTPPCVDLILEKKIRRVVVGTLDMNPVVSGKGVQKLVEHGVDVKVGVLEEECMNLNRFFFKYITKKTPYITLKLAQTLDGKIADLSRDSKWISSGPSRRVVHLLRSRYDAVLVGSGTVKYDNPRLTVRMTEGRNPKRVIVDSDLSLGLKYIIFNSRNEGDVLVITSRTSRAKKDKLQLLKDKHVQVVFAPVDEDGHINLRAAMKLLGGMGISSVLVEGGGKIFTSFVKKNLYDEIRLFISPKLMGRGLDAFGDLGISSISKSLKLSLKSLERVGDDMYAELRK